MKYPAANHSRAGKRLMDSMRVLAQYCANGRSEYLGGDGATN
nr:MAG TPA: hypothetical protein [Caudoviricetes sp.]